ncbi:uncharacterized protein LOC144016416 [Festucalex cinctus]
MDRRKRWSSFDDSREMGSYKESRQFKFLRTTSSAKELYNQRYNEPYNQRYNDEPYNEPYNQPYNEEPYNEQSNERHKKNYGKPRTMNYNEHYNAHFSAPIAAGPSRLESDVSLQRFPREPDVQGAPLSHNKTDGICCCPAHGGNMCPTLAAALPGLLGVAAAAAGGQGCGMMNPFLRFPANKNTAATPAPILFPNFNMMDPVQKAVIKHTFGGRAGRGSAAAKRKQPGKCGVCQVKFNSDSQAQEHYRGSRHARNLNLKLQQSKNKPKKLPVKTAAKDGSSGSAPPTGELGAEQAKKSFYCSICKLSVNSLVQLDEHNSGTKHKAMLDADRSKAGPQAGVKSGRAGPSSKASGPQSKTFQCQTCNLQLNSEIQFKEHISSKKHQDCAAGRPKLNKRRRLEVTTSSDLSLPLQGSASSSLPCPAPGPVGDSKDSAGPVDDSQDSAGPVNDSQDSAGPVNDSQDSAEPVDDSQDSAGPVGDSQDSAEPVDDSQDSAEPVDDSQDSAGPVDDSQDSAGPVDDSQDSAGPVDDSQDSAGPVDDSQDSAVFPPD